MTNPPAVLVVESEALVLTNIILHLQNVGFKVYEATDSDNAIKMLEAHNDIRVVYTDIDTPGFMDGIKLATAVRIRWPSLRIIVTSRRPLDDLDLIPDGAIFMVKPFHYGTITRSITRLSVSYLRCV